MGVSLLKKRIVLFLVVLLVFSNAITYRATRHAYRWRVASPPSSSTGVDQKDEPREELKPFIEVLDILSERYVDDVSVEELISAAIKGMVEHLDDPQTTFLDPTHWEEMMVKLDGTFSGIGIEINSVDDYITIISPIKNTPGERAGLLAGDRILTVDGEVIKGITTMAAVKLMRGPEGSRVTLTVERQGVADPLTFEIVRGNIVMPSVFPKMLEKNMGYIEITTFDEHTGEDFRVALLELETKGMKGLILDLRDNPGGLLSEAVKVGQELLPAGPITHVVDRDGKIMNTYRSYGVDKTYPIVVLVNGASASASEIIAGAFQDSKTATLIGTKTYGKATVQHLAELSNSSGLRYTMAKYQTPSGRDIDGVGLEPDIVVELPEEFIMIHHRLVSDLKPGDENTSVLFLQKILISLKYTVKETGVYDKATEQAVRSFQSKHKLSVTGAVNQETRKKLDVELDQLLEQLDVQMKKAKETLLEKM